MSRIKQIGMAAGTFSVALGIGFVMQNGDALASRFGADNSAPQPVPFTAEGSERAVVVPASLEESPGPADAPVPAALETAQAGMGFSPDTLTDTPEADSAAAVVVPEAASPPEPAEAPVQMASIDPEVLPEVESGALPEPETNCVPEMVAVAGSAATVNLAISAPCHTSTAFTVHHQGMMFTAMTGEDGVAKLSVPALAEVAVMIAAFDNGDGAVANVVVPDFASYDRAVLQWQGDASVMLSAYEGDAGFGAPGHIYAANPGDMSRIEAAEGGYLVRLGDFTVEDGLMAEVYTFPTGMIGSAPDVLLVAEAEITENNCGQELNAQSIQVAPDGSTSALDLTMVMPECDAVGDVLILQNMFEDLTLASR